MPGDARGRGARASAHTMLSAMKAPNLRDTRETLISRTLWPASPRRGGASRRAGGPRSAACWSASVGGVPLPAGVPAVAAAARGGIPALRQRLRRRCCWPVRCGGAVQPRAARGSGTRLRRRRSPAGGAEPGVRRVHPRRGAPDRPVQARPARAAQPGPGGPHREVNVRTSAERESACVLQSAELRWVPAHGRQDQPSRSRLALARTRLMTVIADFHGLPAVGEHGEDRRGAGGRTGGRANG